MAEFPTSARVVIIGGGAVGCSTLYHLAKAGWSDCLLLEKNELTAGSSWHAAGNCPNFSGSWSIMKMQAYSTELYRRLGDEVDYPMNYTVTGAIRLAHSMERMREFERVTAMARTQGIDAFAMMSNSEMVETYPFLETHDLEGGCWDPLDGDIDPAQLTQAFARGARNLGARVERFCPVTGIERDGGEWIVQTPKGNVRCEKVVNASGYYADQIWEMFRPYSRYPDRHLPNAVMAHQYLITEEIDALKTRDTKLPLLRDPDSSYYLRQEKHGLLLGPYERQCRAHWTDSSDPRPEDFSFQLYPDDLERIEWYIEDACARVPILGSVGVTRVVNGPIPYAPDGNPLIGPMPGVENAFEACVFTFGIVQGGGAGKVASEWVMHGETEWDMWSCDPRRFTGYVDQSHALVKAKEIYGHEYAMHFPHYEWPDGRQKRLSPVHEKIARLGARFGARAGWERATFYGQGTDDGSYLANTQTWSREDITFEAVKAECEAVRDGVGICDLPGFSRFAVHGPGAVEWLNTVVSGTVPKPGRIGLVYFADEAGRIVTEMSALRLHEHGAVLITAAGAEWHDQDWLIKHKPADAKFVIENRTEDFSCLVVSGPKSRELLAPLSDADLDAPWLTHQQVKINGRNATLIRISYVGELGWEIHAKNEDYPEIFDAVWNEGQRLGAKPFGMYAMDSLRLEKAYRSWKVDLSTDYTMLAGGLERFVKWDKPEFVGKAALQAIMQQGSQEGFAIMSVDAGVCDAPYLAVVWKGDERVGLVTSGGWGHRVNQSIALGVIRSDCTEPGTEVEIDIYGTRCQATVEAEPHYDPANQRLRS